MLRPKLHRKVKNNAELNLLRATINGSLARLHVNKLQFLRGVRVYQHEPTMREAVQLLLQIKDDEHVKTHGFPE